MTTIKNLDSTAIYAYTTLISVLICVPAALIAEGPRLSAGIDSALAKDPNFYFSLFMVGLLYHLYNQVRTLSQHTHTALCGEVSEQKSPARRALSSTRPLTRA